MNSAIGMETMKDTNAEPIMTRETAEAARQAALVRLQTLEQRAAELAAADARAEAAEQGAAELEAELQRLRDALKRTSRKC